MNTQLTLALGQRKNPYNFAHPVAQADLLVGREDQLEEIEYYLDYAQRDTRPISLAILGPAAAGKTSLLNVTEIKAREAGLFPVRVSLDEGDVSSPIVFFEKILDMLLIGALKEGALGGLGGPTHQYWVKAIYGQLAEGDNTLLFPVEYGLAAGQGNFLAPVSEVAYRTDLETIQAALGKPVVLMIDEADVLKSSRPILQKLRNLISQAPGYMVILSGTDDLFPEMDQVFSPIARQMRRISVDAFSELADTERCVMTPLEKAGLDPYKVVEWDYHDDRKVRLREIHELTGGRPYEINLLCHHMFRRVQQGLAKRMRVDLAVLEEVRKQLEREQNIGKRPILSVVRSSTDEALRALRAFLQADGLADFEGAWTAEYVFSGSSNWTQEQMRRWLDHFAEKGVLENRDGLITFAGDDYDRIYTTYFCKERDIALVFPPANVELEDYWIVRLSAWFRVNQCYRVGYARRGDRREQLSEQGLIEVLNVMSGITEDEQLVKGSLQLFEDLYNLMIHYRDQKDVVVWRATLKLGSIDFMGLFSGPRLQDLGKKSELEASVHLLQVRIKELGGNLQIDEWLVPVYETGRILTTVQALKDKRLLRRLAETHAALAQHLYASHDNRAEAVFHAEIAHRFGVEVWPSLQNSLGYIFLKSGDRQRAQQFFTNALRGTDGDDEEAALIHYNIAVLEAQSGNFDAALEHVNQSIVLARGLDSDDREMAWLIVGSHDGHLRFTEVKAPDLLVAGLETKAALEQTINTSLSANQ